MKRFVAAFAAVVVLAAVMVTLGCAKPAGKTVTVFMWSEYIDPELVKAFEKKNRVKVVLDTYENTETMMSKVASAGDQYDVVVMSDHAVRLMASKGVLLPLDLAKVPNARNVMERFRRPAYDPEGRYTLPYQWGTMGIVYRKDKLPDFKPSWLALFDAARQPGPVVLIDSMRDLMAAALLARGLSPNTRSAADLKIAGDLLSGARTKKLVGYYGSPDSVGKVLAGDAWLGIAYNGDAVSKLDDKTEYAVPMEGTIIWVDALSIPAKAPNVEGAYKFIDYILDGEVGAQLSNFLAYATPNEASLPKIEDSVRKDARVYPPPQALRQMVMLEDVGTATTLYDQVWTRLKAGQ
jgi:spermidine/putrescine transport system substrate-binding protein